jgi:D-alanine-D-alanine ligase
MKKKNIAIMAGGNSSESVISLQSAAQIKSVLDDSKYNIYTVLVEGNNWNVILPGELKSPVDRNDFSFNENGVKIKFDQALIAIHGTPGEDGLLQSYFELTGIPYTTSNPLASALTFNKFTCKSYLKNFGIRMAHSVLVRKGNTIREDDIIKITGLPCFVKPNEGGSSYGVSKITRKEDLAEAIQKAFAEDSEEILIEEYIQGIEITCGLLKTKEEEYILPLTEIVSKTSFFDTKAKYDPAFCDEITPARITAGISKKCQEISSLIYDALNCRGVVRIDYILRDSELYFLEVNTVPGMSAASIVPKQAEVHGMSLGQLLDIILEDTSQ